MTAPAAACTSHKHQMTRRGDASGEVLSWEGAESTLAPDMQLMPVNAGADVHHGGSGPTRDDPGL
jgi:hypothetical protein